MTERHKRLFGMLATACLACSITATPGRCWTAPQGELPDLGGAPAAPVASVEPSAADLERIAQMVSNPLGAAWMLWLQNDLSEHRGDPVPCGERLNSSKFQPVMSFPMDWGKDEWNLIGRPVIHITAKSPAPRHSGLTQGLAHV